jgi:hypothetical protein
MIPAAVADVAVTPRLLGDRRLPQSAKGDPLVERQLAPLAFTRTERLPH